MANYDVWIGFKKTPEGLEAFLAEQGYDREPIEREDAGIEDYVHSEGSPSLMYCSRVLDIKEGEIPDWSKSGHTIVSELYIEAIHDMPGAVDEALRISEEIVKKFDGILYDADLNDFCGKEDLE
jgi:hypothetical protein